MTSVFYSAAAGAISGLFLDVFVDDNPEKVFTIAGTVSALALHSFVSYFGWGATLGGLGSGGWMLLEDNPRKERGCAKTAFILLSGIGVGCLTETLYRHLYRPF